MAKPGQEPAEAMQFVIIARDGKDPGALDRRLQVRERHLANAAKYQEAGHLLMGGALLDDGGRMIGTVAIVQFRSRAELDEWLNNDPYVTGNVWQDIEVLPYRVAPHYHVPKLTAKS